jgi:hypothetical protein
VYPALASLNVRRDYRSNGTESDCRRVENKSAVTVVRFAKGVSHDDCSNRQLGHQRNRRQCRPSSDHRSDNRDGEEDDDRGNSDEPIIISSPLGRLVLKLEGRSEEHEERCDRAEDGVQNCGSDGEGAHLRLIGTRVVEVDFPDSCRPILGGTSGDIPEHWPTGRPSALTVL